MIAMTTFQFHSFLTVGIDAPFHMFISPHSDSPESTFSEKEHAMRKPDRNSLPTTTHVLVVDGSKRPGNRFGGWAYVHLKNRSLEGIKNGSLRTCNHSIETEIEAILQAISDSLSWESTVTIISDCTQAIEKIVKRQLPWGQQEIANLWMENENNTIIWLPSEKLESQKLAHHLANSARIEAGLNTELENLNQSPKKKKTQHYKRIKNLHTHDIQFAT